MDPNTLIESSESSESTEDEVEHMVVITRAGHRTPVQFDEITRHIETLRTISPVLIEVDSPLLAKKAIDSMISEMRTSEIDNLIAREASSMIRRSEQYLAMAARISILNAHKDMCYTYGVEPYYDDGPTLVAKGISYTMVVKHLFKNRYSGYDAPLISKEIHDFFVRSSPVEEAWHEKSRKDVNQAIDMSRDYQRYDYFGFTTLLRKYINWDQDTKKIVELPQHMFMTVSLGIHGVGSPEAIANAIKTYHGMSKGYFTHATPTLLNSGRKKAQLASCYLIAIGGDSLVDIMEATRRCAMISQGGGGIGLNMSNLRARDTPIKSFNGKAHGVGHELLSVFNYLARYVDQCFLPGTIIHTSEGPRPIETIEEGEDVFTASGGIRVVEKRLEHQYDGNVLRFASKYFMSDVLVTPQHQILSLARQPKGLSTMKIEERLSSGVCKAVMVDAEEIAAGDFVCFPVPLGDDILDIPDLDCDDCRFYGLMLGSGWVEKGGDAGLVIKIDLESAGEEKDVQDFITTYLRRYQGDETIAVSPKDDSIEYRWTTGTIAHGFARTHWYNSSGEKMLWPRFFRLPEKKMLSILQGVFEASALGPMGGHSLELDSKIAVDGVRHMLLRCGVMSSGYARDEKGFVISRKETDLLKKVYGLHIPRVPKITQLLANISKRQHMFYPVHDGMMYCKIKRITREHYTGKVYDFEIEDEHTYVSDMGAVHNGGGKRKGAFAIYMEPWHADVEEFLSVRANRGKHELLCNDLHLGLWVPDLFMERVLNNEEWSLFCPVDAPGLYDVYGEEFEELYTWYEREGKARKTMPAVELLNKIMDKQQEVSEPYFMFKDACNRKSGQKNLGTIRGSNLCTEIIQYTSKDEVAVCMLASICLPAFLKHEEIFEEDDSIKDFDITKVMNWSILETVVRQIVRNIDSEITRMWYPLVQAERSNKRHRPMGIGVQGLANVFGMLEIPFDSDQARYLNRVIFANIYRYALLESASLADETGPYPSYKGSPASKGLLQPHLWLEEEEYKKKKYAKYAAGGGSNLFHSPEATKALLSGEISMDMFNIPGPFKNSLLIAPMPTATTAQIMGNMECFEPYTSNIYSRGTNAGDFLVINKELVRSLRKRGLWDRDMRNQILKNKGSVQDIARVPDHLKQVFRTVWEIKQSNILRMAAERGPFIDQNQSLNLHIASPTRSTLISLLLLAWRLGLKSGNYYVRRKAVTCAVAVNSISASTDEARGKKRLDREGIAPTDTLPEVSKKPKHSEKDQEIIRACSLDASARGEDCDACGS